MPALKQILQWSLSGALTRAHTDLTRVCRHLVVEQRSAICYKDISGLESFLKLAHNTSKNVKRIQVTFFTSCKWNNSERTSKKN